MQHVPHESPDGRRRAHSPLCSGAFATGGGVSAHRHCPQARHHDVGGLERGRASELLRHADCGWTHAPCVRQPGAETHVHVRPHPQQRPQENWLVPLLPVWAAFACLCCCYFSLSHGTVHRPAFNSTKLSAVSHPSVCVCMYVYACVCVFVWSINLLTCRAIGHVSKTGAVTLPQLLPRRISERAFKCSAGSGITLRTPLRCGGCAVCCCLKGRERKSSAGCCKW